MNIPTKVVTGKVRLSYCNLFTPRASDEGGDPKFSVCVLIPKADTETVSKIKTAIEAAKQAGVAKFGGKVPPGLKTPLRDGDLERDTAEYKGHWFINASGKSRPAVVDAQLNPLLDAAEMYSGCYGRVSMNMYAYNLNGNRGIAAGLNNVQKLSDGARLDNRSTAEDDFGSDAAYEFMK